MSTKKIYQLLSLMVLIVVLAACNNSKESPGYVYFPDMAYSQAYESFTENPNFRDSITQQAPVPGSIPRGFKPFHYEQTIDDYARSAELINPIANTEENITEGKHFYNIYCAICHGEGGEADGTIVKREKFQAPPSYFAEYMMELPDGKMFYSIHFGLRNMGSYASQLSQEERWKVILYINSLQDKNAGIGESDTTGAETTELTMDPDSITVN